MKALALTLFLLVPAQAEERFGELEGFVRVGTRTLSGYDEFHFLGWGPSCTAAVAYFSYPPTGSELSGLPDTWAVGSLTIPPAAGTVEKRWVAQGINARAYIEKEVEQKIDELMRTGYKHAGLVERIRPDPLAKRPDLDRILRSTSIFQSAMPEDWPPPSYELREIRYSPLGTCALFLFRDIGVPRDSWRYRLLDVRNPGARRERARAHVTNGLLLYQDNADLAGAEEELAIAAGMDPEFALALYHHSTLLAAQGRFEESLAQLKSAVAKDKKFAEQAKTAVEFESIRKQGKFKNIVGIKPMRFIPSRYKDQYLR